MGHESSVEQQPRASTETFYWMSENCKVHPCLSAQSLQSCPTLCNLMDCSSPPGSSVHGILQARIVEWVAMPFTRGSSRTRDRICVPCVSCIAGRLFNHWTTCEAPCLIRNKTQYKTQNKHPTLAVEVWFEPNSPFLPFLVGVPVLHVWLKFTPVNLGQTPEDNWMELMTDGEGWAISNNYRDKNDHLSVLMFLLPTISSLPYFPILYHKLQGRQHCACHSLFCQWSK